MSRQATFIYLLPPLGGAEIAYAHVIGSALQPAALAGHSRQQLYK